MSIYCPEVKRNVLYLDCMECDTKTCKNPCTEPEKIVDNEPYEEGTRIRITKIKEKDFVDNYSFLNGKEGTILKYLPTIKGFNEREAYMVQIKGFEENFEIEPDEFIVIKKEL